MSIVGGISESFHAFVQSSTTSQGSFSFRITDLGQSNESMRKQIDVAIDSIERKRKKHRTIRTLDEISYRTGLSDIDKVSLSQGIHERVDMMNHSMKIVRHDMILNLSITKHNHISLIISQHARIVRHRLWVRALCKCA